MLLEKENVNEVQRRKNESGTPSLACVTVSRLRDKFGVDGTVQTVDKECSEGLEVQLSKEVRRRCYMSSDDLQKICTAMLS
jgi:hypothetical protein